MQKKVLPDILRNIPRRRNPAVLPLLLRPALTGRTSLSAITAIRSSCLLLFGWEPQPVYPGDIRRHSLAITGEPIAACIRIFLIVGAPLGSHLQPFSLHPSQHPHTPLSNNPAQLRLYQSNYRMAPGILCKSSKDLLSSSLLLSFIDHVQNPITHLLPLSSTVFKHVPETYTRKTGGNTSILRSVPLYLLFLSEVRFSLSAHASLSRIPALQTIFPRGCVSASSG